MNTDGLKVLLGSILLLAVAGSFASVTTVAQMSPSPTMTPSPAMTPSRQGLNQAVQLPQV